MASKSLAAARLLLACALAVAVAGAQPGCAGPSRLPARLPAPPGVPAPAPRAQDVAPGSTFANPLDLDYRFMPTGPGYRTAADPMILLWKGDYYLFASSTGGYWWSPDMRAWTLVLPRGLPLVGDYAPSVIPDGGRLLMTASKSKAIYATDDPKRGEWYEVADLASYSDPTLFRDDDGRLFLYHGASLNGSIKVVELDPGDFHVLRGPIDLFSANYADHGWERSGAENLGAAGMAEGFRIAPYIEGSEITKHGGTYYLQYSAPGTIWKTYADGVYTSSSPTGPFRYQPYSPFSYKPGGFVGSAGHADTFQDKRGNYWRVVTMVVSVAHKFERRLGIFPAGFDADGVMRTDTYLGDYPQYLPGVVEQPLDHNRVGWLLLSGGRPATASSSLEGHGPELAFDEDIRTQWSAATGNAGEWLEVDLGAPARIDAVQVNLGEQEATARGRDSTLYARWRLEASQDGKSWTTLVDRSGASTDAPHAYVQLERSRTARWVRLGNVHVSGGGRFAVRDLRLFGLGAGSAPAAPAGLEVRRDPEDGRNAVLSWAPAAGARAYLVRYGLAPDKLYSSYEVGAATRLELHSLNRGVTYYFTVDAVNAAGVTRGTEVRKG